ncbi:MAG: hypothetical protein Q9182_007225 [Xanthomendoza sp. 2 TL-2023]
MFSASSSASGLSSMVSREEMLGERDRKDVGVEGMLEEEKLELEGKGSLYEMMLREGLDVLVRSGVEVGGCRYVGVLADEAEKEAHRMLVALGFDGGLAGQGDLTDELRWWGSLESVKSELEPSMERREGCWMSENGHGSG